MIGNMVLLPYYQITVKLPYCIDMVNYHIANNMVTLPYYQKYGTMIPYYADMVSSHIVINMVMLPYYITYGKFSIINIIW